MDEKTWVVVGRSVRELDRGGVVEEAAGDQNGKEFLGCTSSNQNSG
jgi:hypothetical protein